MSYTKNHLAEQLGRSALEQFLAEVKRDQRAERLERIDRLAWEIKSATNDLLRELQALEADRNDDAGRRADAAIAAGDNPF